MMNVWVGFADTGGRELQEIPRVLAPFEMCYVSNGGAGNPVLTNAHSVEFMVPSGVSLGSPKYPLVLFFASQKGLSFASYDGAGQAMTPPGGGPVEWTLTPNSIDLEIVGLDPEARQKLIAQLPNNTPMVEDESEPPAKLEGSTTSQAQEIKDLADLMAQKIQVQSLASNLMLKGYPDGAPVPLGGAAAHLYKAASMLGIAMNQALLESLLPDVTQRVTAAKAHLDATLIRDLIKVELQDVKEGAEWTHYKEPSSMPEAAQKIGTKLTPILVEFLKVNFKLHP